MAEYLVASGSRRITQLTTVSGISGSTSMPIVMGGSTVQVSHTDFLNSTVFNRTLLSGSAQVVQLLPNGTVSGSSQINYSGISNIPSGIVSSSTQVISSLPSGTVSGSAQVISLLPTGTVSGSSQISFNGIADKPTLVSSSQQIRNYGIFATTGSNTFRGNQIVSASVDVSGSVNADGFTLDATSTTNIPSLNSQFNLDLSGSVTPFIYKTLALQDGKVLVAGRFESIGGHTTNDIARLNADGTVDTSFTAANIGGGGVGAASQYINNFVTESNGKIIAVGNFTAVQGLLTTGVARFTANGVHDTSLASPAFSSFSEVRDVVIQNDDKIVVVGNFDGGIKRLQTNGTIDTSLVVTDTTGFTTDSFYSVALQTVSSTDYILVGGTFNQWNTSTDYKKIARIGINGSLDTSFGGTNLDISSAADDVIRKIKVGDDNNVYVAGKFLDTTGLNRHAGFARILTTDDYGDGIGAFDRFFRTYIAVGATVFDFDFYSTDKILLGGNFGQIGFASVQSANKFVIVDSDSGNTVSNWFTDILAARYNVGNNSVHSVLQIPSTTNVLLGGTFTSVNSTTRENLASLKLTGFGNVTTFRNYSITADTNQLLISSSNTYFSGNVNISGSVTTSVFSGSFVGDGTGLTGFSTFPFSGSAEITGSLEVTQTISTQIVLTPQVLTGHLVVPIGFNGMLTGPVSNGGELTIEGGSNLVII